ncbi:MAG: MarR family transcriptional regulator [Pigmentiphaga sp.]|nr:MarR family transcriptional regulator [Pigmentiphaga sp.]
MTTRRSAGPAKPGGAGPGRRSLEPRTPPSRKEATAGEHAGGASVGPAEGEVRLTDIGTRLGFHLKRVGLLSNNAYMRSAAKYEVLSGHFGILEIVLDNPGINQRKIGEALGLDKSSISPAVTKLEKRGLIKRRSGPVRRSYELFITPLGESLLQSLRACADEHEKKLAAPLSPEERELLIHLLDRVFGHLARTL